MVNKANSQYFFTFFEKQAILNFIDEATGYKSPAQLYIIVKKATLFIFLQIDNLYPIRIHWVCQFVNCYP